MIAPASGSGRWPAWIARVPKPTFASSSKARVIPRVPVKMRQDKTKALPTPNEPKPSSTSLPATCLIVDDEPRLRQVLVQLMRADGFHCLEAGNGVEALEV